MKSYTFTMKATPNFDAGDEVIMSIAGHVSRAMLSRYSHVRMEAKRRALDEIAARQRSADEKREEQTERQQKTVASESVVVQCMRQANPIYTAARVGDAVMGWTNQRKWYRSGGGGVAGKLSNWWPNTKPAG